MKHTIIQQIFSVLSVLWTKVVSSLATQFTSQDSQALEQELERHHLEDELWDVEETCHFAHLHPFPFFCLCKRGNQGGCC